MISPSIGSRYPGRILAAGAEERCSKGYKLQSTWNSKGHPTSTQQIWRNFTGRKSRLVPGAVLQWLANEAQGYLAEEKIGRRCRRGNRLAG